MQLKHYKDQEEQLKEATRSRRVYICDLHRCKLTCIPTKQESPFADLLFSRYLLSHIVHIDLTIGDTETLRLKEIESVEES